MLIKRIALIAAADKFQTPSERGGIVLVTINCRRGTDLSGFKPLQNGAVLC